MLTKKRALWLGMLLLIGVCSATSISAAPARQAIRIEMTAYKVALTHYEPWWEPHYGAWFGGYNCTNYRYVGPGSQPPAPDWWGNYHHVALLSKSWLAGNSNGWNASYHKATCYV
jgi:hypothetical protein